MGTAEVTVFDVGAATSEFAPGMERGRGRPEPLPDARKAPTGRRRPAGTRSRLTQPLGVLEKYDDSNDERGLRGPDFPFGFARPAPGPDDTTAIISKVMSLSTGQ